MKVFARIFPLLSAALLAVAPAVQSQSAADLPTGTRVRVAEQAPGRLVGTVTEVRGDTLLVLARGQVHAVPFSSIRTIQVSRGRPPRLASALEGGAIGLLTGAIGGAASLAIPSLLVPDACDREGDGVLCFSTGEWALIGVVIGAPLGAASGAVAGFVFPRERWRRVEPAGTTPRLSVHSGAGGLRIGFSVPTP
jgi:hypothetical protein